MKRDLHIETRSTLVTTYRCIQVLLERFRCELRIPPRLSQDLVSILRYIHEHLFEAGLSVAIVKNRCGVRNNNVTSRFRRQLGLGMRQYIEGLRLQAANLLLTEIDCEVYLIAQAVGYEHQETFYRAFRRCFGCTPVQRRAT